MTYPGPDTTRRPGALPGMGPTPEPKSPGWDRCGNWQWKQTTSGGHMIPATFGWVWVGDPDTPESERGEKPPGAPSASPTPPKQQD